MAMAFLPLIALLKRSDANHFDPIPFITRKKGESLPLSKERNALIV